jgi:hypothetical protein
MRFKLALFTLIIALPAFAQRELVRVAEDCLQEARGMIEYAVRQVPRSERSRIERMAAKARVARMEDAEGTHRCDGTNAMLAPVNGSVIYVCDVFLYSRNMDGHHERLHAVIHEIAHLSGVRGGEEHEEANRLAYLVMDLN